MAFGVSHRIRLMPQIDAQGLSRDGKAAGITSPESPGGNQHLLLASRALTDFHI
jgi:hypothetical protein